MAPLKFLLRVLNADDNRDSLAETFEEELHFQSSRVILFACVASLIWLLYIPIDSQLHPDQPIIVTLRWMLVLVSIVTLILYKTPTVRQQSQYLLLFWGGYLILAAGAISGITGNDPTYLPGFILTMCLLPMAPVQKRFAYFVLFTAVLTFLIVGLLNGINLYSTRMRYSLNDLLSAVIALSFFIYVLDRIRRSSWENAKLIEAESRKKIDKAKEESRAKSHFLATMSHEIRTPMNGVIGMTELLHASDLAPQQRQYVEVISNSGKALLNIINDILDYSKIEAGKLELEKVDFDLDKLCLDVASVFSLSSEKKKLEFLVSIKPGTPIFIKTDPTRLRQILLNLIGNAFKFTHQGGIYIRVASQKDDNKDIIRFEIQDTGIGMSEAHMAKLFAAFTQADSTTTRKFGGTGLGLSISKSLAELMGGQIGVQSEQGKGSTFWFTIEYTPADQAFVEQHRIPTGALQDKRVLFVDDSVEFTQVVVEQANGWGMRAEAAYHGEEALEKLQQAADDGDPYDIASLDMNMPGMDGMTLAKAIKERANLAQTKCVLLTAMRVTPPQKELAAAGIRTAMQKPASARSIKECFLRLLGEQLNQDLHNQEKTHQPLQGMNLLVAEDNAVNQIVIKNMLNKLGAECTIAENGFSAVRHYEGQAPSFDLILMDCEMPEMDGFDATRAIRKMERQNQMPHKPILALTAHAMKEHIVLCHEAGMDDCLSKPIELDSLRDKLTEHANINQ